MPCVNLSIRNETRNVPSAQGHDIQKNWSLASSLPVRKNEEWWEDLGRREHTVSEGRRWSLFLTCLSQLGDPMILFSWQHWLSIQWPLTPTNRGSSSPPSKTSLWLEAFSQQSPPQLSDHVKLILLFQLGREWIVEKILTKKETNISTVAQWP